MMKESNEKVNVRKLLEDDARIFRAVLELSPTDTLEMSDGERTVSVSGVLALMLLKALKKYVSDQLDVTLRSLAAMDDEEDEEGEKCKSRKK